MALAHRRQDAHVSLGSQCAPLVLPAGSRVAPWTPRGTDYPSGSQKRAGPPDDPGSLALRPKDTRRVLVVSVWEGKTDWYRNIEREPALEVRTGRVAYRPVQEFLSPEETARLILTLFRQRPREARLLGPLLGIDPDADEARLYARLEAFFRGVRFRPAGAS
jgi:hypothetical protein